MKFHFKHAMSYSVLNGAGLAALIFLLHCGAACSGIRSPTIEPDELVASLTNGDPESRRAASSWAWEAGPYAIEPLAALLDDPDPNVRLNARRALWTIVHRATRPGADRERALAGESLAGVLRNRKILGLSTEDQRQVMRMLALTACRENTINTVADYLNDPELNEMALFALERIDHSAAEKALIKALESGGGSAMAEGAARALAARQSKAALPALLLLAESSQGQTGEKVRHALARSGEPMAEDTLLAAIEDGKPGAPEDLLLFAERRFHRGDKRGALKLFKRLLDREEAHLRAAAVRGVGYSGNIISHRDVMDKLGDADLAVRGEAYQALLRLPGDKISADLKSAFRTGTYVVREGILRVLTRRGDPEASDLVMAALGDAAPEVRYTAFELLGEFDDSSLETFLLEAAEQGSPQEREAALESYLDHADRRLSRGEEEKALQMYHRLLAEDPASTVVREALKGVVAVGSPDSLEIIRPLVREPGLREDVNWARLTIATKLMETDRRLALTIFDKVCRESGSRSLRQKAAAKLRNLGEDTSTYPKRNGFLVNWHLIGPFPGQAETQFGTAHFDVEDVDLSRSVEAGDRMLTWKAYTTEDLDGVVDLLHLKPNQNVTAYGYTEFNWDREEEAMLKVGSDDGIALWFNDKDVYKHDISRGLTVDEDKVAVRFKAGKNRLLVKVSQGGGDWAFCVRITDRKGHIVDLTKQGSEP
jgi:HEAT repeat protein